MVRADDILRIERRRPGCHRSLSQNARGLSIHEFAVPSTSETSVACGSAQCDGLKFAVSFPHKLEPVTGSQIAKLCPPQLREIVKILHFQGHAAWLSRMNVRAWIHQGLRPLYSVELSLPVRPSLFVILAWFAMPAGFPFQLQTHPRPNH